MRSEFKKAAAIVLLVWFWSWNAQAQSVPVCARITPTNLVKCALSASLGVEVERSELAAAQARKVAASPLLPSNPTLSFAVSRRTAPAAGTVSNWRASLDQELEVAGQRGVRRDAAEAQVQVQTKRVLLTRRGVAAAAWEAYYDALAGREEERLATSLADATRTVATVARARADKGLIAPVEADLADATAIRTLQAELAAERHRAAADAALASLLGLDPEAAPLALEGELIPIPSVSVDRSSAPASTSKRLELALLATEERAQELRADAYRRSRVPNPTLSIFAENDGFDERVLGIGVSVPLPLPGNVGRTYVGEIAEAEALARRASAERERTLRELRLRIVTAARALESRRKEVQAFAPDSLGRATVNLRSLGQEVEAGRLGVRDAVFLQQGLIELLQANVAARLAWCLASVEFARAAGAPLEEALP